jgi:mycofactocin precursor
MVCFLQRIEYQQQNEDIPMAETTRPTGEAAINEETPIIENSNAEQSTEAVELDEELELEEELIIEDFTIDGICGVY